jgi:hypothetical protein
MEGVDAGPDSAAASNGSVGDAADVPPTDGTGTELGPFVDAAAAGATVAGAAAAAADELVGLAEDTGAAASDADETGPAIADKPTATRVVRCVTTLR